MSRMKDQATMRVEQLRERVERSDYTVDPGAVADALLRRLVLGRAFAMPGSLRASGGGRMRGPSSAAGRNGRSGGVLEA